MEWKDLAPWIAIAFTLALSILVPLFTQIANNKHQRKMQREKIEYEEKQKKTKALEAFLLDVGGTVVCRSTDNLQKAGSSLFRLYVYAPESWLEDLDALSNAIRRGDHGNSSALMQKIARLIAEELNEKELDKSSKKQ